MREKFLKNLLNNKEIITYGITGVITTIVNYLTYYVLCNILHISSLLSNAVAWIIAVIFAYIMNNFIVFKSSFVSFKNEVNKIIKFFAARTISFIFEEVSMLILIDILGYNNLIVKASLMIFVVIINYVFSKKYIFNS